MCNTRECGTSFGDKGDPCLCGLAEGHAGKHCCFDCGGLHSDAVPPAVPAPQHLVTVHSNEAGRFWICTCGEKWIYCYDNLKAIAEHTGESLPAAAIAKTSSQPEKPRLPVGVSVLLIRDGKVLLGERINNTAAGLYSTPGGRLEQNEDRFDCAIREVAEETGIVLTRDNLTDVSVREHLRYGDHYVMFYVTCNVFNGEPQNLEPSKCKAWEWFEQGKIPSNCTELPDVIRSAFSLVPVTAKPCPECGNPAATGCFDYEMDKLARLEFIQQNTFPHGKCYSTEDLLKAYGEQLLAKYTAALAGIGVERKEQGWFNKAAAEQELHNVILNAVCVLAGDCEHRDIDFSEFIAAGGNKCLLCIAELLRQREQQITDILADLKRVGVDGHDLAEFINARAESAEDRCAKREAEMRRIVADIKHNYGTRRIGSLAVVVQRIEDALADTKTCGECNAERGTE